jgi:hypothetical protein
MDETLKICIAMGGIAGILGGVLLVAYDDHTQTRLYKRLRCKMGWHKMHTRIGFLKIHKYYCEYCRKERSHPKLTAIDGGRKWMNERYKG